MSMMKKTNIDGFSKSEAISNSLEGLYAYLTATNIRYKIKHPLFLLFKFSNCLKLFYNPKFKLEEEEKNPKIINSCSRRIHYQWIPE